MRVPLSLERKEALWALSVMAWPRPSTPSVVNGLISKVFEVW